MIHVNMSGYRTPANEPDVYIEAATASVRAEGINDGYIAATAREAPFRAAVDVAYERGVAAGRKQAAAEALMAARDDLDRTADRLRAKARETGDKTHFGTAAGVSLACFRLVELADRATRTEGGEPNAG